MIMTPCKCTIYVRLHAHVHIWRTHMPTHMQVSMTLTIGELHKRATSAQFAKRIDEYWSTISASRRPFTDAPKFWTTIYPAEPSFLRFIDPQLGNTSISTHEFKQLTSVRFLPPRTVPLKILCICMASQCIPCTHPLYRCGVVSPRYSVSIREWRRNNSRPIR